MGQNNPYFPGCAGQIPCACPPRTLALWPRTSFPHDTAGGPEDPVADRRGEGATQVNAPDHEEGVQAGNTNNSAQDHSEHGSNDSQRERGTPHVECWLVKHHGMVVVKTRDKHFFAGQCPDFGRFLEVYLSRRKCVQFAFCHQFWINIWRSKFEQKADSVLLV